MYMRPNAERTKGTGLVNILGKTEADVVISEAGLNPDSYGRHYIY